MPGYVLPDPTNIPDCDQALTLATIAYLSAEERGDLDQAAGAYERLDHLLEVRLHLPQQRPPID